MKKGITILGSTGSIGKQALEVVDQFPDHFTVKALTANVNHIELAEQATRYRPEMVVIGDGDLCQEIKEMLSGTGVYVKTGGEAIHEAIALEGVDFVLNALVGFAGLEPTLYAIRAGKTVGLANKESMVAGGELVKTALQHTTGTSLIPVDSEHSAIFQCMRGERYCDVEKLILTASGGPFHGKNLEYLGSVTTKEALLHPNWSMGPKITIDSATLMNKGLEVIEARWLFDIPVSKIEVLIHPQSIVHSMVAFRDGSVKAQLSPPDMRLAIHYAMAWPGRMKNRFPRLDLAGLGQLTFEKPDVENFRNLALAYRALEKGGNAPCVLNASNEAAVDAFLRGKIGFTDIPRLVEACLDDFEFVEHPELEDLIWTDRAAREKAASLTGR